MALKAKETKKSLIKQFQMKGNTYSVVIVKNDKMTLQNLWHILFLLFKIKKKCWMDVGLGGIGECPVKSVLNT